MIRFYYLYNHNFFTHGTTMKPYPDGRVGQVRAYSPRHEVTLTAKNADPDGLRTLGLITKPDTSDVGSESDGYVVHLAQNLEEKLRRGRHVPKSEGLRNAMLPQPSVMPFRASFSRRICGSP